MLISRKLAVKVRGRLGIIAGYIETAKPEKALAAVHDLVELINSRIETREDEQARAKREESSS